jgi:hypothetical protein
MLAVPPLRHKTSAVKLMLPRPFSLSKMSSVALVSRGSPRRVEPLSSRFLGLAGQVVDDRHGEALLVWPDWKVRVPLVKGNNPPTDRRVGSRELAVMPAPVAPLVRVVMVADGGLAREMGLRSPARRC